MRLLENAAHGDPADGVRELQGSGDNGTLAGGHRNRFSRIPLAMKDALDPFRRGHQPGQFFGEIDPGLAAQAQFTTVVRKAINAQAHPDVVEKDIAGLQDCFMQAHHTVRTFPIDPTLELPAIKSGVARAKRRERFGRILVLQHGGGGYDFENRARRKLRLNGSIQQRMLRIFVETLPVICRDTDREIIGVQSRMADHGQDFSGARVQRDCRTRAPAQGLLRNFLQVVINGQQNLFARNGFLSGQALLFLANTVYNYTAHSVRALEQVVVLAFQAGLPDEVAGAELAVARLNLLLADFTDIARSVGEEAARQISPAGDGNHFQDRNVGTMGFNKSDIRLRGVGLDNDGLEFREILCVCELVLQIIDRDSQAVRDSRKMLLNLGQIIAQEEHAERRPVVHQNPAIAVQHAAARRNHGNVTHAVALGHGAVLIGVDDLELPEADEQHADHAHDEVGGHGQPRLRQSIVVAEPVRHENPAREYFYLRAFRPIRPNLTKLAGLNSRHEKIHSVGFELTPIRSRSRRKCPSKISSTWDTKKSPGAPE